MNTLNLISDNKIEEIWGYLSQYESPKQAEKLIGFPGSDEDTVQQKATGLAYCLRNAREYFSTNQTPSLTARILNSYYGFMALIEAKMIAKPTSEHTLTTIEKATTYGHGIKSISSNSELDSFPDNEKVYLTKNGLLKTYLEFLELPHNFFNESIYQKNINGNNILNPKMQIYLISLDQLFARVAEIRQIYESTASKSCLNLQFTQHNEDLIITKTHYQDIEKIAEILNINDTSSISENNNKIVVPRSSIKINLTVHQHADQLQFIFQPIFKEIQDKFALHFMLLYHLSIIVRYRPSLWREICEGEYNDYLPLIRSYIYHIQRIAPELALFDIAKLKFNTVKTW
jgi:hypothetical protein